MNAVDVHGRFVWHELMTRDVPGAKKFYSKLVGWKPEAWAHDPNYTVNHSAEGPQSGFFTIPADMPADMPAHWVSYIGTRDVDGLADAAVRAGGSVVKAPEDIKGAGRYAVLRDPQGAIFAVLDPENSRPEREGMPPNGSFSWHELATSDHESAFAFYSGLFGWDVLARHDMGPMGIYLIFGNGNIQRGGMFIKPAENPGPPAWLPYVSIPSVDDGHVTAQSAGGRSLVPPQTVPGGSRIAQLLDPTGAAIAIHSMPAAAMPAAEPAAKPKAPKAAKPKAKTKTKVKAKAKAKPKAKTAPKAKSRKAPKKKAAARKPAAKKRVSKSSKAKKSTARRKK
ncbi:MAG TPA: VOC family protein [Steroidobacteraceae bacterium]|nr:VOC family protein [Steroidobacteraceae bacterium]